METKTARTTKGVVPLRIAVGAVVLLGLLSILPLWAPLVLAAWTAHLLERIATRWARHLRGRKGAALALT
ncbi:MAG TPA: hypothetical protein VF103_10880, partial [Polyangiaceae bacterium]